MDSATSLPKISVASQTANALVSGVRGSLGERLTGHHALYRERDHHRGHEQLIRRWIKHAANDGSHAVPSRQEAVDLHGAIGFSETRNAEQAGQNEPDQTRQQ